MTKKENTRDELLIENHELKQVIRKQAKVLCELGGVGYNVPIFFDNKIMFNSAKYGEVVTCPMDDKILTSELILSASSFFFFICASNEDISSSFC